MGENIPEKLEISYEACWTENDGVYGCGCFHASIEEALRCMRRDGTSFVRAVENGVTRSLDDTEIGEYLMALGKVSGRTPPS